MSNKAEKKMRQLFRRDMRDTVKELTEQHFKQGPVFNLKPKYCPLWFWNWCAHFICDELFLVRYRAYLRDNPEKRHEYQKED